MPPLAFWKVHDSCGDLCGLNDPNCHINENCYKYKPFLGTNRDSCMQSCRFITILVESSTHSRPCKQHKKQSRQRSQSQTTTQKTYITCPIKGPFLKGKLSSNHHFFRFHAILLECKLKETLNHRAS